VPPKSAETERSEALTVPAILSPDAVDVFVAGLERLVADSPAELVLDCGALDYVASSHIGLLWQASRICSSAGIRIRLRSPSSGLLRVLNTLDLCQFFDIGANHDDVTSPLTSAPSGECSREHLVYQDTFLAGAQSVADAIERFVRFLKVLALPESLGFELRTVFYEVVYNVHLHSGLGPDAEVVVRVEARPHGMTLTFTDAGVPFDPTRAQTVSTFVDVARGRQNRGLGLPMLSKLTDRMVYTRTNDGKNVFTLDKTWGDSGD
jgi:anti-anti-sigma factor